MSRKKKKKRGIYIVMMIDPLLPLIRSAFQEKSKTAEEEVKQEDEVSKVSL